MADREKFALPERLRDVLIGFALGAIWGAVLWGLTSFGGSESGGRGLAYLTLTSAMIGGGVAAVFSARRARRRGERVLPRGPYRRGP